MNEEIRNLVGARLKEEREKLAWPQALLGQVASVSKRSVAAWESGETAPGADALALLSAKGVDVLYVVTGMRMPTFPEGIEQGNQLTQLTPRQQVLIKNYEAADDIGKTYIEGTATLAAEPKVKYSNDGREL